MRKFIFAVVMMFMFVVTAASFTACLASSRKHSAHIGPTPPPTCGNPQDPRCNPNTN